VRRDWWGRALAALIGIWVAGMIAVPAGARANVHVDALRAQRALPDRTDVVSARDAVPDSDPTPPARAVARECSGACGEGGRHVAEGLPAESVIEVAGGRYLHRVGPRTAPRRRGASVAHILPPALGPPTTLV
jgi:hypothetical protein